MPDQLDGAGKAQRPAASHLFLVRLWEEPGDGEHGGNASGPPASADGATSREWKGKVQHVVSGESHTFQDLPSLLDYLRSMMPAPAPAPSTPAIGPATAE